MLRNLLFVLCLFSPAAFSAIDAYTFDSEAQEQLFKSLTKELRCPKCQNQDIADSNASLAQDLRQKTYLMVKEGKDKQAVIDYMVARYGNFVLYNPPMMPSTVVLWVAPVVVIGLGGGLLFWRSRRQKVTPSPLPETALTPEEQARLQALLNEDKP
jgi:cytochrome c-type biogenesis protein CcmH